MKIWKKNDPFNGGIAVPNSGTNQLTWEQYVMTLPSGMAYSDDVYQFPAVNQLMKDDNIIKYFCKRCGSKILVNKEKLPAMQILNCLSCGSSDLEEIK